ncbi:hypothetical protein K438DRAFT_318053 [Mycena galopus ATCC 62051]|nr:hypothetical protein K438DRAFT_318053 [Mycena galopus ATCC 62051]
MADMTAFREDLLRDPFYLGGPKVTENVTWKKVGREEMAVSAKAAAAHESAIEQAKATEADDDNKQTELGDLDPVGLTLVATISPTDCWLTPCGFWKGPTSYTPTFADLKLNCRLVTPTDPLFAPDFERALKNVETLAAKVETKGQEKKGIFDLGKTSLKLRHVVFEEKEETDEEDPDAFQLQDWPVKSPAAQESLDRMDATHRVIPISAYDVYGDLILPIQYTSALMGAVVRATFTMTHWNISRDKRDSYAADIESLRVLVPAQKTASGGSSPRKRKVPATTDPGPSPVKKSRVVD